MDERFALLLGFAQRAGKAVSGESAAQAILKKKKGFLVIVAHDASERTKQNYLVQCRANGLPYIIGGSRLELGLALGRSPRSVVVITEDGFARSLQEASGQQFTWDAE